MSGFFNTHDCWLAVKQSYNLFSACSFLASLKNSFTTMQKACSLEITPVCKQKSL